MIIRPFVYKPAQFEMAQILKVYTMIADILSRDDDDFNIKGQVCVYHKPVWKFFN